MTDSLNALRIRSEGRLDLFEGYARRWERAAASLESATWYEESNVSVWRAVTPTDEERAAQEEFRSLEETRPIVARLQDAQQRTAQRAQEHLRHLHLEPAEGLLAVTQLGGHLPIHSHVIGLDLQRVAVWTLAVFVAPVVAVFAGLLIEKQLGLSKWSLHPDGDGSYTFTGGIGTPCWLPLAVMTFMLTSLVRSLRTPTHVIITNDALITGKRRVLLTGIEKLELARLGNRLILRHGGGSVDLPVGSEAAVMKHLTARGVTVTQAVEEKD